MLKKAIFISVFSVCVMLGGGTASASEIIKATGSSTIYPFLTAVAEKFAKTTKYKRPVVKHAGTAIGFEVFCAGTGEETTDVVNASRPITKEERQLCEAHGVTDITEIKIGYDGIVLANSVQAEKFNLTKKQIFKALANEVPVNGRLVKNPYKTWHEIDASLPHSKIEVYGPPVTSGTRDAFAELVMEKACINMHEFRAAYPDKRKRRDMCHRMRSDGVFIEAGENDALIVEELKKDPTAIGILGFNFLDRNMDSIHGSFINGIMPTFDTIKTGSYPVSRALYVYFKNVHLGHTAGLKAFAKELVSESTIGPEGYLVDKGLIPLGNRELQQQVSKLERM